MASPALDYAPSLPARVVRPHLALVPAASATAAALPNFFVVGAPKCGTTALYAWLSQHPEIFMPRGKEPHFFGSDLDWRHRDPMGVQEYLDLFRDAGHAPRVGEASTMYLYSREAAREIFEFNPEARIIVMLRNPVDQMYSFHSERLYGQNEDIQDFREALKAEGERRQGARIPALARLVQGCFYREVACYSAQVQRYFEAFGRDGVHVILYDDLRRDPAAVFEGVCKFLEVDPTFRPEFSVVNGNKTLRSPGLERLLRDRSSSWRGALRRVLPKPVRRRVFRGIGRANARNSARAPLAPELRRELQLEMAPEVRRLSRVLERDLSHWVREA